MGKVCHGTLKRGLKKHTIKSEKVQLIKSSNKKSTPPNNRGRRKKMIVKIFTKDDDTINFLKENIKYYAIKGDIIDTFGEDYKPKNKLIILYNINSIDYQIANKTIKLYYQNISINIKIDNIDDLFIEKQ